MSDKVRLIDAELLTTNIALIAKNCARDNVQMALVDCILSIINNMPTVEVKHDKRWISVKDRMPEPETWAMVYLKYPSPVFEVERSIQKMSSIKKLFYDGVNFYCDFGAITHWMPLPEPPEGGIQ